MLLALPATVVDAWIGRRLYNRLDSRAFSNVVLVLLLAAGVVLVVTGLWPRPV